MLPEELAGMLERLGCVQGVASGPKCPYVSTGGRRVICFSCRKQFVDVLIKGLHR